MHLWTFQATQSVRELEQTGRLTAKWTRYSPHDKVWMVAYRWMANQMNQKNIYDGTTAPIWAWHSCGAFYKVPTLGDARALLCDLELEGGMQVVEFDCPDELVLLSKYSTWNIVVDGFYEEKQPEILMDVDLSELFDVFAQPLATYDSIQATLPFLDKKWVVDIRPLNLKIGDYEGYNEKEEV